MKKEMTLWSLDLTVDLQGCKEELYKEKEIKLFAQAINKKIDTRNSEILGVVNSEFGKHEENMRGFRLVHESQNTLITGHFVNKDKKAYINIHSCLPYSVTDIINLICEIANPDSCKFKKILRE